MAQFMKNPSTQQQQNVGGGGITLANQQQMSSQYEYEYQIGPTNKQESLINTSASNIIAGGGTIVSANAYNMSFLSGVHDQAPPSRGVGTRKMMAAVASGIIEEASPHSSKHDLIVASTQNNNLNQYRKRF